MALDEVIVRPSRDRFGNDPGFPTRPVPRGGGGGGGGPPGQPRIVVTEDPTTGTETVDVTAPRGRSAFVFPVLTLPAARRLRPSAKTVSRISKLGRINLLGVLAAAMGVAISALTKLSDKKVRDLLAQWQIGRIDLPPTEISPPLELEEVIVKTPRLTPARVDVPQELPWWPRFPQKIPGPDFYPPPTRLPVEVPAPYLQPFGDPDLNPIAFPIPVPVPVPNPSVAFPFEMPFTSPVEFRYPFPDPRPATRPGTRPGAPPRPGLGFPGPGLGMPLTPFEQPLLPSDPTRSDRCPPCGKEKDKKRKKKQPRNVCYRGTYYENSKSLTKYRKEKIPCQRSKKR